MSPEPKILTMAETDHALIGPPQPTESDPVALPSTIHYPIDEWALISTRFDETALGHVESVFNVGNGYLGIRGTHPEARPRFHPGTYINGFHETWDIVHAEDAFGFAQTGQTMVSVPDGSVIKLYVDDEPLYLPLASLPEYELRLDFRTAILRRDLLWETPSGKRVRVETERFVSLAHRHLAVVTFEVTVENAEAPVLISSQIINRQDAAPLDEPEEPEGSNGAPPDPRRSRSFDDRVLMPALHQAHDGRLLLGYRTRKSRMVVACGAQHTVTTDLDWQCQSECDTDHAKDVFSFRAKPGQPFRLVKYLSYHSSRSVPPGELADRVDRTLTRAVAEGVDRHRADQRAWLEEFWDRTDVRIPGQPRVQQAVRWSLLQLANASARSDGLGIPSKGLSGDGYEGHYFWDSEIYVMPVLAYTRPLAARNLLRHRYSMLPAARRRAREVNQVGALFPWRTINGEEASAYYAAGTAQYHINADIAHALQQYVEVSGDRTALAEFGAEIMIETARLWVDLGFYGRDGRFHIHNVTGPDEYTTLVNDNLFTNAMARQNLWNAVAVLATLRSEDPDQFAVVAEMVDLQPDEASSWQRAADAMFIPYDADAGINPQDVNFLDKEVWDFDRTSKEQYPLLLHFHPLVIYRFQVIKQADVVLAMMLLGEHFDADLKQRNFEYYDRLTTGDSSLSASVQSIIAAEVGEADEAMRYFRRSLMVDLADLHGNAVDGVHMANAGGVWMSLVNGFAGLREHHGRLSFDPRMPAAWESISFSLLVRGSSLRVDLSASEIGFVCDDGPHVEVSVRGTPVMVGPTRTSIEL